MNVLQPELLTRRSVLGADNLEDLCAQICLLFFIACVLWVIVSHFFEVPVPKVLEQKSLVT